MRVRDGLDLLPLRQMVSASGDAAHVFARQGLLDWLSRPHRYRIAGHGQGGKILAISELALAEAQALLRQTYGSCVTFGAVTVHTYVDAQTGALMVPRMFLRVDAPGAHTRALLQLLEEHGVDTQEVEDVQDRVVIRAEALLSASLGLERRIGELTGGAAHTLCWLLRYQPARSPGTGD